MGKSHVARPLILNLGRFKGEVLDTMCSSKNQLLPFFARLVFLESPPCLFLDAHF